MRDSRCRLPVLAACALLLAAPATAQQRGTVSIAIHSGGAAFSGFQGVVVAPPAGSAESQGFAGRLAASPSATFGGSVTYWAGSRWGIRAQLGLTASTLEVRMDDEDWQQFEASREQGSAEDLNDVRVLLGDASLVLQLPIRWGAIRPFATVGAGLVSYDIRPSEREAEVESGITHGRRTRPAAVLSGGAVVPLRTEKIALFFELSDYVTHTPIEPSSREQVVEGESMIVRLNRSAGEPQAATAESIRWTNNVRFLAGFTFMVGR